MTQPGPSLIEKFYTDLRRCRRHCDRKPFIEHRRDCPSATDPDYRCDKRRNFVSAIERGAQGLDARRLGLTADALGVDLDWLLNGPDQNVTDAAPVPD